MRFFVQVRGRERERERVLLYVYDCVCIYTHTMTDGGVEGDPLFQNVNTIPCVNADG